MRHALVSFVVLSIGCANGGGDAAPGSDAGRDAADGSADTGATQTDGGSIFPVEDPTEDAAPPSCNAAAPTAWSSPTALTDVTGVSKTGPAVDPYVLPNGLALLFSAPGPNGKQRPHFVTRPNRGVSFSGGAQIGGFDGTEWDGVDIGQPTAVSVDEMLFTTPINMGDLWVATAASGTLASKRYGETFINTGDFEGMPTLTADRERMIFARAVSGHYELFEATRLSTAPGTPWVGVSPITPINNASYSVACPALSPDGLTLYFTSNAEAPGTLQTTIFVTQRTSRTTAFGTPTAVPALSAPGKLNCPRSITADGCELYLSNDSSGKMQAYSARRSM